MLPRNNRYAVDEEDSIYVLENSFGKDSLACLGAIEKLRLPLHKIVHREVWATDTIPAELPPMIDFKLKAEEIIYKRYGIKVEHIFAIKDGGGCFPTKKCSTDSLPKGGGKEVLKDSHKLLEVGAKSLNTSIHPLTYEDIFYRNIRGGVYGFPIMGGELVHGAQNESKIMGFATRWSQYCTGELKKGVFTKPERDGL